MRLRLPRRCGGAFCFRGFSPCRAQRGAENHPLCGWMATRFAKPPPLLDARDCPGRGRSGCRGAVAAYGPEGLQPVAREADARALHRVRAEVWAQNHLQPNQGGPGGGPLRVDRRARRGRDREARRVGRGPPVSRSTGRASRGAGIRSRGDGSARLMGSPRAKRRCGPNVARTGRLQARGRHRKGYTLRASHPFKGCF